MTIDTRLLVPMTDANQNFSKVVRIVDESGMAVILKNNKTNKDKELEVSGLFIAIGHIPNSQIVKSIINLTTDNYIDSSDCKTNADGIFVAGDVRSKSLRQLVTATSDGALAATLAINYLDD